MREGLYSSDLTFSSGSCPCLWPWPKTHGAHLACWVDGNKHADTAHAVLYFLGALLKTKDALRDEAKTHRADLHKTLTEAPAQISERFPEKLIDRFGPIISIYLPIGSELDPTPLMSRLRKLGAELSLPRIEADNTMSFRRYAAGDELEDADFGLTQPLASAEIVKPTLVLTPLLAFDRKGNRLGYGQGHYDRARAALREKGRVFVCGLAFADQEVDELPSEPTDIPLDWIVTEGGSIPLFMARAVPQN